MSEETPRHSDDHPDEPELDPASLVAIHSLYDAGVAEVLRVALAEAGIPAFIDGERQAGMTGVLPMRLLVRAQDADRARRLLREHGTPPID